MNFEKLTAYIDSLNKSYDIPGVSVIVTKGYETVYRHAAGHSDYAGTKEVRDDDLYLLYSASKVITAVAVLQLVEKGQLSLYDEVARFLPAYGVLKVADEFDIHQNPPVWPTQETPHHIARNSIRIIDLLTMTAGLSYDCLAAELKVVKERSGGKAGTIEVVNAMADMVLPFEPRTRWRYSLALDVLGAVVETVSGLSFGEYLRINLFEPLGIEDITFHPNEEQKGRLAALYRSVPTADPARDDIVPYPEGYNTEFRFTDAYESGGAGLYGTSGEYIKFAMALANNGVGATGARILSEASIKLLQTPYTRGSLQEDFTLVEKYGYSYGLGVRVLTDPASSKSNLGEFGWDSAGGAYVLADPKEKIAIFYAQHIYGFPRVYTEIHPVVRDLAYEAIRG